MYEHKRSKAGSAESSWGEALALMCRGPPDRPAWNLESLKCALLFADFENVADVLSTCSFRPRERGFTALIKFFGRLMDVQKAERIFDAMKEVGGVRPNTFTYSALISAYSSCGQWEKGVSVLRDMKEQGRSDPECRPNVVAYTTAITACERGGQPGLALELYHEMLADKVAPDQGAFVAAVAACTQTEKWRESEEILDNMHERGYVAPEGLYGDLMAKYAEIGDWNKGLELFLTVQMVGLDVDRNMCRDLMLSFERGGQPELVMQLWEEVRKVDIDIDTYNSALRALSRVGDGDGALAILRSIEEKDLDPNVETVSVVLDSLTACRRFSDIVKVKREYKHLLPHSTAGDAGCVMIS